MNTNKLVMKLLMAATLLVLLFSTACAFKNEIQSSDGQALIQQGNAYMTCLKEVDLECAYELMSSFAQHLLDDTESFTAGILNLDSVVKMYAPKISAWAFDRAQFSTRDGIAIGSLEGQVDYIDGKRGKMNLEFEKDGETWKVRSTNLEK
jgi:zinc transporter ZupT